MANILKRIRNIWAWGQTSPEELFEILNPTPETIEKWREITEPFRVKPDGKAEVLPLMTEEEMTRYIKEEELGWKAIFDKVRNLGK